MVRSTLNVTRVKRAVAVASSALLIDLGLTVTIVMITYPYTLNLTAPATVLINSKLKTRQKLLVHNNSVLRTLRRISAIIFSGAKALALNRPAIAIAQPVNSRLARTSLLRLTTAMRDNAHRPLTITVRGTTAGRSLPLLATASFTARPNFNVTTRIA